MIALRRLNGTAFQLNAELIEQVESAPDTVITLTTGNNLIVLDTVDEVVNKVIEYKARITAEAKEIKKK